MIKKTIKRIIDRLSDLIKIRNVILFESVPDYSDNTRKVFDEFINRGFNDKYTFVWVCNEESSIGKLNIKFKKLDNVRIVYANSIKYKFYYRKCAKAFVTCNQLLEKSKKVQYYCDLAHGCAFKNCAGKYSLPSGCENGDVMTISNYMAKYDAINLSCDVKCMKNLGYARNDDLFNTKNEFPSIIGNCDKVIYWMPTYRQHKWSEEVHSDISMPIIHDSKLANKVNSVCQRNNVFMIIKLHNAQNASLVNQNNLSNIAYIDNSYIESLNISNYELLGNCDALISDYSSVYYDFLLCDKPIGLCWEDFDSYANSEGFTVDPQLIMAGGEKIYTVDDLCSFVESVANEKDPLKEERNKIKLMVHDHVDNQSTNRIVDYLIEKIEDVK